MRSPCAGLCHLLHLEAVFEMITACYLHQYALSMGLERSRHMPKPNNFLTAQEFAKTAGVSPATVSKWLREGTVSGVKRSGKW